MFETLIDLRGILSFIIVLFQAIGFLGLILVGSSRFRKESTINKSVILIIVGAVEIIYLVINQRIYYLIYRIQGFLTLQLLAMQDALYRLVPNIISLITFGALFLYLGISNRRNYGKLLMLSAIFRIVCGIILIIPYSITFLSNLPYTITLQELQLAYIIIPIASIFMITSSVFFMIYASKIDKKVLFFSSIFLLVASSLFFVNSLVQHMILNI
ncbi:MAG: hypothetical protein EAX91_06065 [Candidatus Lokiarchaeota archaeon]|nr:hypothetical protein [Candidatus Lokiarchaeota archaeon]